MGYGWWGEDYALYWDIRIILEDRFILLLSFNENKICLKFDSVVKLSLYYTTLVFMHCD